MKAVRKEEVKLPINKFQGQGRGSKFVVTGGKQWFSNCWDSRMQMKSKPELDTVNK